MAPDKVEGPTTRLTFLGIELDAIALTAHLPDGKLHRLQAMLLAWQDFKVCAPSESFCP